MLERNNNNGTWYDLTQGGDKHIDFIYTSQKLFPLADASSPGCGN